jgi:nitrate reductase delta subunit
MGRLAREDGLDVEAQYVDLFDRGRGTALHLFEHVHGDSRDRGPAMIDLIQTYEQAGLLLGPDELPDHLSVVLEFASTQPPEAARAFLGEFAHLLQAIRESLLRRRSDYASCWARCWTWPRSTRPLASAKPAAPEPSLDESWAEPEVFGGCSSAGQQAPASPTHPGRPPFARPSTPAPGA